VMLRPAVKAHVAATPNSGISTALASSAPRLAPTNSGVEWRDAIVVPNGTRFGDESAAATFENSPFV
jgi:hypothetical protein